MQIQWDVPGLALALFSPAAVGGLVSYAVQRVTEGGVKFRVEKALEDFKAQRQLDLKTYEAELARVAEEAKAQHQRDLKAYEAELAGIAEKARFNYSRRLADFNLFAVKRHEVYPELFRQYRAVLNAYSDYGLRYHRDTQRHEALDKREVEALMIEERVPATRQEGVIAQWTVDRADGVRLLHDALDRVYLRRAHVLLDGAAQFWLANYVYVASGVNEFVEKTLTPKFVIYAQFLEGTKETDDDFKDRNKESYAYLETVFETFAKLLRKELTTGDYEAVGASAGASDDGTDQQRTSGDGTPVKAPPGTPASTLEKAVDQRA